MRTFILGLLLCGLLAGGASAASVEPGTAVLDAATRQQLARTAPGASQPVAAFPLGAGVSGPIAFRRIEIYAPDARIYRVDADGVHEIPRSARIHLIGISADGATRVGLSFDPAAADAPVGSGSGPAGPFVLNARRQGADWVLTAVTPEAALPEGVTPQFTPNADTAMAPDYVAPVLDLAGTTPAGAGYASMAVIAVDTDTELMSERFSNNTAQATAWIADLFAQMNITYQRDLNVTLKQGTTFLRTTTDPYANTDSPASQAQLTEFGNYWQANYSSGANAVPRQFAMLLSGKSPSGNSASGIAWLNAYCRTASSGGSYSVSQVFTNPGIGIPSSAFIVGHELGHNFGARHTHCASAANGSGPTGSGTIDQCFRGESGCYSGTPVCPSSGPGAPRGSLMSYCHIGAPNGANCGQNELQFHPTHVNQLRGLVAANTPSCLRSELIFANGFQ